jgi:branched-chain amino acid transport system substrate-binding protein
MRIEKGMVMKLSVGSSAASAVLMLMGGGAAIAQDAETTGLTPNEIKIGMFGPVTGPAYLYGKIAMNGAEAVFDQINAAGGIHGRKLVLVREDDACKPEGAIAAAKKLIHETKVFAIIGSSCSNSTLAARPEIEKSGIPFIQDAATADGVTIPVVKNIFTTQVTATIESRAQIDYVLNKGFKKVALVAMKDAWGMARYEPFMKYAAEKKLNLVENLELQGDGLDATPQALKLKAAGVDAIILILYPKAAAIMMRDSLKLGVNPVWVGQSTIADLKAFEGQVGVPGSMNNFVTISSTRFDPSDPKVAAWNERIKKLFPNDELSPFNFYGVGSAQVMAEALKRAGQGTTRTKLNEAIEGITDFRSEAFFGPINCSKAANHQCNQQPGWFTMRDGKLVEVN